MSKYDSNITVSFSVKVTLRGLINSQTGMVENITKLKEYMERAIMTKMDHKNLDQDVEFFKLHPSTTENVAYFIWKEMRAVMDKPELLYEVKIRETNNNSVTYRGEVND